MALNSNPYKSKCLSQCVPAGGPGSLRKTESDRGGGRAVQPGHDQFPSENEGQRTQDQREGNGHGKKKRMLTYIHYLYNMYKTIQSQNDVTSGKSNLVLSHVRS